MHVARAVSSLGYDRVVGKELQVCSGVVLPPEVKDSSIDSSDTRSRDGSNTRGSGRAARVVHSSDLY